MKIDYGLLVKIEVVLVAIITSFIVLSPKITNLTNLLSLIDTELIYFIYMEVRLMVKK